MSATDLFDALQRENLTHLVIRSDRRSERVVVQAGVAWDRAVAWEDYGFELTPDTPLSAQPFELTPEQTIRRLAQQGAGGYLAPIIESFRAGGHEHLGLYREPTRGLRVVAAIHSRTLGLRNGRSAQVAGGLRCQPRSESERHVVLDLLRLSRAMSFKNAAAELSYGGCKFALHGSLEPEDAGAWAFVAYLIDRLRACTGPDVRFGPDEIDRLREFTPNAMGGHESPLGPVGGYTALGVALALESTFEHLSESLAGQTVAVQGLGAVGAALVRELLDRDVKQVLVADIDDSRVEALLTSLGSAQQRCRVVSTDEILFQPVDALCPCALGGVFDPETIDRLQCRVIVGAANNPLRASSPAGELALSRQLSRRGILFQVDWIANAGGLIAGMLAFEQGSSLDRSALRARIESVCGRSGGDLLAAARDADRTPLEEAQHRFGERLRPGSDLA
ncbi:MAG: hypothetical protein RL885_10400 [Planctomycetota bacterium]